MSSNVPLMGLPQHHVPPACAVLLRGDVPRGVSVPASLRLDEAELLLLGTNVCWPWGEAVVQGGEQSRRWEIPSNSELFPKVQAWARLLVPGISTLLPNVLCCALGKPLGRGRARARPFPELL